MKAAVLHETGAPLRLEDLELEPPREHEVAVRVVASGVCHSDLSIANGTLRSPLPVVLGHELGGVVETIGPGVEGLAPGDHVIAALTPSCGSCATCRDGSPNLCVQSVKPLNQSTMPDGSTRLRSGERPVHQLCAVASFAEYSVIPAGAAIAVPKDVPLETVCLIGCGVTTGLGAVLNTAQVREGSTVAVIGCGGVGLSIVQGARISRAETIIAIEPVAEKRELALSLGATHAVDPGHEDVVKAVRGITGLGVHYAFEALGRVDTIQQAWSLLRPGGRAVVVGMPHLKEKLTLRMSGFFSERGIIGSVYGSSAPKRDIPRFVEMYRKGELELEAMITSRITLGDVNDALDALARGEGARTVIRIADA